MTLIVLCPDTWNCSEFIARCLPIPTCKYSFYKTRYPIPSELQRCKLKSAFSLPSKQTLGVPFRVKQAKNDVFLCTFLTNIPEYFLSSKALDILCTALSKRTNQTMLCFKAETTASSSWQLLLFSLTKHLVCLQITFFGLTILQKWYTLLGAVIFLFISSTRLSTQKQNFSNFLIQVLGPMSNLCLLVLKCNPLKESFISLQDDMCLFFLISLPEQYCDASEIASSVHLLVLSQVSPNMKPLKRSDFSGYSHSCHGIIVTIDTNREVSCRGTSFIVARGMYRCCWSQCQIM